MLVRYGMPVLAILALAFAIISTNRATPPVVHAEPPSPPPVAAYADQLGAVGLVEAASENIAVSLPVPGLVTRVAVQAGDTVQAGQLLFSLDDRDLRAELALRESAVALAQSRLTKLEASPRPEEIPPAQSRIDEAKAQVARIQADLERLRVTAPISGKILQCKVRPGEYAASGTLAQPLILMGRVDQLHLRADIDEKEAWRFAPGTEASASVRGNSQLKYQLTFVRVEPYVVPKKNLTGDATERVDTRVLQAIYALPKGAQLYPGQQMDLSIRAQEEAH